MRWITVKEVDESDFRSFQEKFAIIQRICGFLYPLLMSSLQRPPILIQKIVLIDTSGGIDGSRKDV